MQTIAAGILVEKDQWLELLMAADNRAPERTSRNADQRIADAALTSPC